MEIGHELMTLDEVAEYLRLNRKTLKNWRALGIGPAGFKLGRTVVYRRESVRRWLADVEESGTGGDAA